MKKCNIPFNFSVRPPVT